MCEKENCVANYTNDVLIQNIYCLIERLLIHRKYILDNINKKNGEIISNIIFHLSEKSENQRNNLIFKVIEKKIEDKSKFFNECFNITSMSKLNDSIKPKIHLNTMTFTSNNKCRINDNYLSQKNFINKNKDKKTLFRTKLE